MTRKFSIIVAVDSDFGIGKNGQIPWRLSADMRHFKEITTFVRQHGRKNAVIMGRRTWESLPPQFRPLPDRINFVMSRNDSLILPVGTFLVSDLSCALQKIAIDFRDQVEEVFVIGGAQIYSEAINHPDCQKLYLTLIQKSFQCDVFFPRNLMAFQKVSESALLAESGLEFNFQIYTRK